MHSVLLSVESVTLHKKWESMGNVYLYKADYFPWIEITTLHEKLITLHMSWIQLIRRIYLDSIKKS